MNSRRGHQDGFSLAEMLTVVAIVGTLALVTVPAFITYYQSGKMKSSMRNFTQDLRSTRQLAITQGKQAMLSYSTGTTARAYDIYLGDKPFNSTSWTARTGATATTRRGTRYLDDVIYFPADSVTTPQTFTDTVSCATLPCTAGTDGRRDIIFFPDGHAQLPGGSTSGTITLKTDRKIWKTQYTIAVSPSGRVQAQ